MDHCLIYAQQQWSDHQISLHRIFIPDAERIPALSYCALNAYPIIADIRNI